MTPESAAAAALEVSVDSLEHARRSLDLGAVVEAARVIDEARFVVTCGSGSSGFAAAKFAHSLCCVEKPAKFMPPAEAIHGGLGAVQRGDAVVIASRGGRTAELLPIIDVALRKGARIIGLTENDESDLARASEVLIKLTVKRESDPLETMATSSNLIVGAVLDAVLAALMVRTDYSLEQFALIHPGGAVGARLNEGR